MLYHHDARNYEEAASAAADNARAKMQALIDKGKQKVGQMIQNVAKRKIDDQVVELGDIAWDSDAMGIRLYKKGHGDSATSRGLHRHALAQATERLHIPIKYVEHLRTLGAPGHKLVADNLRDLSAINSKTRVLLRRDEAHENILGFLSDRYRRIDTPKTLDAFASTAMEIGAVPVEGYTGIHTKTAIKALLPYVFEPVKNEVVALGMLFENSDYGDGKCSVRVFILRLWCTNFAITENALSQVHLGGRLSDDVEFSRRTYELDAETTASAIKDVVKNHLAPDGVKRVLDGIKAANEAKVDPKEIDGWLKKHLTKDTAGKVLGAFASADIENMPPGQNAWRLSNALSWCAQNVEDEADKLEMMKLAGKAMDVGKAKN